MASETSIAISMHSEALPSLGAIYKLRTEGKYRSEVHIRDLLMNTGQHRCFRSR